MDFAKKYVDHPFTITELRDPERLEFFIAGLKKRVSFQARDNGRITQEAYVLSEKVGLRYLVLDSFFKTAKGREDVKVILGNWFKDAFCIILVVNSWLAEEEEEEESIYDNQNYRSLICVRHDNLGFRMILGVLKFDRKGRLKKVAFEESGKEVFGQAHIDNGLITFRNNLNIMVP